MQQIIIGVDPHKLSATIEVVDKHEQRLGSGRFTTDRAGYAAMRTYAKSWPERMWAVEGANGAGPGDAQPRWRPRPPTSAPAMTSRRSASRRSRPGRS